jgi:hypothetical protein
VEELRDDVQRDGLSTDTIRVDVELRLRLAGVRVLSREGVEDPGGGGPFLASASCACWVTRRVLRLVVDVIPAGNISASQCGDSLLQSNVVFFDPMSGTLLIPVISSSPCGVNPN